MLDLLILLFVSSHHLEGKIPKCDRFILTFLSYEICAREEVKDSWSLSQPWFADGDSQLQGARAQGTLNNVSFMLASISFY